MNTTLPQHSRTLLYWMLISICLSLLTIGCATEGNDDDDDDNNETIAALVDEFFDQSSGSSSSTPSTNTNSDTEADPNQNTDLQKQGIPDIEILGKYTDGHSVHRITENEWISGGATFEFRSVNNDEKYALALNGSNTFSPGTYSRFEWTTDNSGNSFYCQTLFAADTLEDADVESNLADPSDLAKGCGVGFSWSQLTPLTEDTLSISGYFTDTFSIHGFLPDTWANGDSMFFLAEVNEDDQYALFFNGANNSFNPNLFSRFEWTETDTGDLYYCQTAFDAASIEDARNATPADTSDPASGGCGGIFAWSLLTPAAEDAIAIVGNYNDGFSDQLIAERQWTTQGVDFEGNNFTSKFFLLEVDNENQAATALNGPNNGFNPNLYSRFEWAETQNGEIYYCQTAFAAASAEEARNTPAADRSDITASGCGGTFPWSLLTKLSPDTP